MAGCVELRAYAELNDFLALELRGTTVRRPFRAHQTVKDVVEAAGIPHTEVDLILVDGRSVGFEHRPAAGFRLAVYPVFETLDVGPVTRLRPVPLRHPRFVVDVHLGTLARLLRLVGFDTVWANDLDDDRIVTLARAEDRIVLTQDRGLLKRRDVTVEPVSDQPRSCRYIAVRVDGCRRVLPASTRCRPGSPRRWHPGRRGDRRRIAASRC